MRSPRVRFTVLGLPLVVGFACLGLGLARATLRWYGNPYITVRVFNETSRPLSGVRVSYTGGRSSVETIMPGQVASLKIRSSGESDISLSYTGADGQRRTVDDNAYIESGYRGSFEFHVGADEVKTVSRISAYPPS